MICYPGKEFVEKQKLYKPYQYYDYDTGFHLVADAPEEAKKSL